mgnify:CR=1 FL=1
MPEGLNMAQLRAFADWYQNIAKPRGWYPTNEFRFEDNGTAVLTVRDPGNKRHWLRIDPQGNITFAPVTMTCF